MDTQHPITETLGIRTYANRELIANPVSRTAFLGEGMRGIAESHARERFRAASAIDVDITEVVIIEELDPSMPFDLPDWPPRDGAVRIQVKARITVTP